MTFDTIISVEELNKYYNLNEIISIDCRFNVSDPNEGLRSHQKSHIPGSQYAHLDDDLSGPIVPGTTGRHTLPDRKVLAEKIRNWGINRESQVMIYDQSHGGIAARLWWLLNWMGLDKVAVLNGGWAAWIDTDLPTSAETIFPKRSDFQDVETGWATKTAADVATAIAGGDVCLIDSRSSVRYQGLEEPLDPIAGHIPTAINRPFLHNLADDGFWKSKADLKTEWESILGSVKSKDAMIYCGSGVTACHNLLAIKHAGLDSASLYSGSWSEWITDSSRAIVTPT